MSGGLFGIVVFDIVEEVSFVVGIVFFGVGFDLVRFEEVVGDFGGGDLFGLVFDVVEELVGVVVEGVVEVVFFGWVFYVVGVGLFDFDVGELGGWGFGWGGGGGGELFDFEGYGCEVDYFVGYLVDVLEGEVGFDGGGKGFVLVWGV